MRRSIPFVLLAVLAVAPQCTDAEATVPIPPAEGPVPKLVALGEMRSTTDLAALRGAIYAEFMKTVAEPDRGFVDARHLPARLRSFVDESTGRYMWEFETAVPVDAKALARNMTGRPMRAVRGVPHAYTDGVVSIRAIRPDGERPRLLVGDLFGPEPAKNPWFHHRVDAALSKPEARLLARVEDRFLQGFVRGAVFAQADPLLRPLLGIVGPRGLNAALGVKEEDGRAVIDYHLGLRVGEGILGTLLPTDAGDAQPLITPTFQPAVALLVDLGPSVARLADFGLRTAEAAGMPEPVVTALRTLANSLTGRLNVFTSPGGITYVLLELEEGTEQDVDGVLEPLQGLFQAPGGEATLGRKERILELELRPPGAPERPAAGTWSSPFDGIAAPVKFWGGKALIDQMLAVQQRRSGMVAKDPLVRRGVESGHAVAKTVFKDRIVFTVTWDKTGTHLRLRL